MLNMILIALGLYFAACYAWGVYVAVQLSTGKPLKHLFRGKLDVHATPRQVTHTPMPTRFGSTRDELPPATRVTTATNTAAATNDRAAA